jgi:aspartate-semialdehyde dehydrogenase
VGSQFLRILEESAHPDLPIKHLRLFASARSVGKKIAFRGEEYGVELATTNPADYEGLDLVLTALAEDSQSTVFCPPIAKAGALVVDKSNAFRMDPDVPLVVPEVNPEDAREHKGIIAGPNCSTTQMVLALWPIHRVNPIQRIIVDTYQAVSGTGWRALDELQAQISGGSQAPEVYPHQIHLNVIPEIGSYNADGIYGEEQ